MTASLISYLETELRDDVVRPLFYGLQSIRGVVNVISALEIAGRGLEFLVDSLEIFNVVSFSLHTVYTTTLHAKLWP